MQLQVCQKITEAVYDGKLKLLTVLPGTAWRKHALSWDTESRCFLNVLHGRPASLQANNQTLTSEVASSSKFRVQTTCKQTSLPQRLPCMRWRRNSKSQWPPA